MLTIRCRQDWPAEEKIHLGEELSDVMIYLVRLAGAIDALTKAFWIARRSIRVLTVAVVSARHPQTSATSTCRPRSRTRWSRTPTSIPPSWYALDHPTRLDTVCCGVPHTDGLVLPGQGLVQEVQPVQERQQCSHLSYHRSTTRRSTARHRAPSRQRLDNQTRSLFKDLSFMFCSASPRYQSNRHAD